MKKIVLILLPIFILVFSATTFAGDVGIGFEFGTNFLIDTEGETGASNVFNLNFELADDLSIGYYNETLDGDIGGFATINALQVKNKINDSLNAGIRFGNAENGLYSGVFGSVTTISRNSNTYSGELNLNLGYDFVPSNTTITEDGLFEFGISSLIKF